MIKLLFLILISIQSFSLEVINNCFDGPGKIHKWKYCLTETVGSHSKDVIYFFHGAGQTETSWFDEMQKPELRTAWEKFGENAPMVISISFGKLWLLAPKNTSKASGLYEYVLNFVLPYLNDHVLSDYKGKKYLFGASRCGFNSFMFYLRNPNYFDKFAIICPMLQDLYPWSSLDQHKQYATEVNGDLLNVFGVTSLEKKYFDEETWKQENPFNYINQSDLSKSSPLYLSCGSEDQFGFYTGTLFMANYFKSISLDITWDPVPGKHCAVNISKLFSFVIGDVEQINPSNILEIQSHF